MNLLCPAITLALVGLTVLTNFFFYSSPQASNEPAPVLLRGTDTVAAGESGGGDYHNDGAAADTTNRLEGRLQEVESLVSELQTRLSNLTRARALDESNHRNESMLDDASSEGNEKKEKNAPKSKKLLPLHYAYMPPMPGLLHLLNFAPTQSKNRYR